MKKESDKKFSDYIVPLEINGLSGRMLRMPAPATSKREMLLIYGHHASLERMQGFAELLNDYGGVTMADLPGFGGMESFYKIKQKPDLDTMADYLAAFIKLRYRNRRFTIIGLSYGFLVATRMLQRYPDIAKKVDLLVSAVGFTHKDEFKFTRSRYLAYLYATKFFSMRVPSWFFRNLALHPLVIRTVYTKTHNAKHKFKNLTSEMHKRAVDFEVHLWRVNDARTYMATAASFLQVDNCQVKIDLPVCHLYAKNDNYFDNNVVEQHLQVIFNSLISMPIRMDSHSVSVIATKKESAPMVPPKLRALLAQRP